MRKICARCLHWVPPKDKPIFCDVEGVCLYRPPGEPGGGTPRYECLTEACGCCEFYEPNPELASGQGGDDY
jgi:hypothetical protein